MTQPSLKVSEEEYRQIAKERIWYDSLTDGQVGSERVADALSAVGPGLNDLLVEVCLRGRTLRQAEKKFVWPRGSASVVLEIALNRLVTYYHEVDALSQAREEG